MKTLATVIFMFLDLQVIFFPLYFLSSFIKREKKASSFLMKRNHVTWGYTVMLLRLSTQSTSIDFREVLLYGGLP